MVCAFTAVARYSILRYAYEDKEVVVLRKEVPGSPFHWFIRVFIAYVGIKLL